VNQRETALKLVTSTESQQQNYFDTITTASTPVVQESYGTESIRTINRYNETDRYILQQLLIEKTPQRQVAESLEIPLATLNRKATLLCHKFVLDWLAFRFPIPETLRLKYLVIHEATVFEEDRGNFIRNDTSIEELADGVKLLTDWTHMSRRYQPGCKHLQHWDDGTRMSDALKVSSIRPYGIHTETFQSSQVSRLCLVLRLENVVIGFLWSDYALEASTIYMAAWYILGPIPMDRSKIKAFSAFGHLVRSHKSVDITSPISTVAKQFIENMFGEISEFNLFFEVDNLSGTKSSDAYFLTRAALFSRFLNNSPVRVIDIPYSTPAFKNDTLEYPESRYALFWGCSRRDGVENNQISKLKVEKFLDFLFGLYTNNKMKTRSIDAIQRHKQSILSEMPNSVGCFLASQYDLCRYAFCKREQDSSHHNSFASTVPHRYLDEEKHLHTLSLRQLSTFVPQLAEEFSEYYYSNVFTQCFPDPDDQEPISVTKGYFQSPSSSSDLILLLKNGQIIGGSHIVVASSSIFRFGVEFYIAIHPEFQNSGLGKLFYSDIRDRLGANGCAFLIGEMKDPYLNTGCDFSIRRRDFWMKVNRKAIDIPFVTPLANSEANPNYDYLINIDFIDPYAKKFFAKGVALGDIVEVVKALVEAYERPSNPDLWQASFDELMKFLNAFPPTDGRVNIIPLDQRRTCLADWIQFCGSKLDQ
jgi:GNAT superfamily N-acetyltransferase